MSSTITVRGFAATQPKFVIVNGLSISSFRVGSSERRFNRASGSWENGPTSWYSVSCFRELATNAFASLNKGDPVIVHGRLKVSEWSAGDKSGLDVEIEAESIGHDFRWGRSVGFAKNNGRQASGRDDGAGAREEEQPPDERDETAPSWNPPGLELAGSQVLDAGEPLGLDDGRDGGLDEAREEGAEGVGAGAPPF